MDKHFSISVVSPKKNHFATITTDITGIRQIQEVISAKNKELENYIYITSHDLRSPLVNIQGFSQRLQKQADSIKAILSDSHLSPATKAHIGAITDKGIPKTLNFIFSNVTKMDTLLNGLLHLSRTGRIVMAIKQIDINQLFKTIIDNFNFQLTELDAMITVEDLPSCYGDENLLSQLFSNIIGNAIKYRDKNRRLVIEITGYLEFRKAIYSIRDNGLGIESRHLKKIWDVFYMVDSTLADAGEGLGLSSVKRIAEKHNGRVWAESESGKGSVFYVELQTIEFYE
jgi:signal transduction histidine kinase